MKVSFQGEKGSYSESVAIAYFGIEAKTFSAETFESVLEYVESGQCNYGVLPLENSLSGSIHSNYDLLIRHNLAIVGEYYLRVNHCLISQPNALIGDIRQIVSDHQALIECKEYIRSLGMPARAISDTASGVQMVRDQEDYSLAAIASKHAADLYGMKILAEGIEDSPLNYTRFIILSKTSITPQENSKTSIVFTLKNKPGSLFKALSVFALRDVDLVKIESRPLVGKPWDYLFYIDFLGSTNDEKVSRALKNLDEYAFSIRVFGSYYHHNYTIPNSY